MTVENRIDEIDRRILYHLATDARNTSAPMIADKVDVTPATIRNRIRELEAAGIIQGYHASIDYERDDGLTEVEFTCTVTPATRERIAQEVTEVSGVVQVRELATGRENLRITAVGTDSNDLSRITRELSALGVEITQQAIVHNELTQAYHRFAPDEDAGTASLTDLRSLSGGAEIVEFTVAETAPITDRTLADANSSGLLPDDVLVISLERGDTIQAPNGETTIQAGDIITVFSRQSLPPETVEAFEPDEEHAADSK